MSKPAKRVRQTSGAGYPPTPDQIALLAYELWQQRGCPMGSPEEDWNRAETELQHGTHAVVAAGAKSSAMSGG